MWCCLSGIAYSKSSPQANPSLSLDEAILLAVRSNPNVQSSQLSYVSQKFNLWIQEWKFYPHYSFEASASYNTIKTNDLIKSGHHYNAQPSISLLTPYGTEATLSAANPQIRNYNPGVSLKIMQPLMRGFGKAVVEASLNNARDSDVISRLNNEGVLRVTVTDVINAYLNVVAAEQTVLIDKEAVKRAETSVTQTKIFIQAGHKAGNEIVTVQANLASVRTQLENDKNSLMQMRYALLQSIGLDPNSGIQFKSLDVQRLIQKYRKPTLAQTKRFALENDISYQTAKITLSGQKTRDLILAEDNSRWKLDMSATLGAGNGVGGGQNAGTGSLINGLNQSQEVMLTLKIPIDDQTSKQAVANAKIALTQARIELRKEKWSKETNAINGWNNVASAERALSFAEDAEKLQEKTYNVNYQKYLHGLIDSLELQSALISLIQAKQTSLNSRINYLRALVNLDMLIGNTLKTWKINVRL